MTAVLSGEADIGFMGPETTVYAFNEGASDVVKNFAQLTQRAGNFLIAREQAEDFKWTDLKGANVLGGRAGGMPEMVFEFVLKKNNIDPAKDLNIDQSIDFGSTAAAFSGGSGDYTVEFEPSATALESEGAGYVVASVGVDSGYVPYTAFSAKLPHRPPRNHPGVHRRAPERHAVRNRSQQRGNRRRHRPAVFGDRQENHCRHCIPLQRAGHLEKRRNLYRRRLHAAS